MKYLFLYKELNTNNRDCVAYIDNNVNWFVCNHYFRSINIHGPCYSMSLGDIKYNNIKTILSKDEFNQIKLFNKRITKLGSGIIEGDDRYKLGIKYIKDIQPIFDKLESQENQILFDEVIKEEREYLKSEYNITDIDIDYIFDSYYLDYRDRAIISQIYEDAESAGREYLESTGDVPEYLEDYMDYEKFGRDLLEYEDYLELEDNKVVYLNY